jgi:hypothetical protein
MYRSGRCGPAPWISRSDFISNFFRDRPGKGTVDKRAAPIPGQINEEADGKRIQNWKLGRLILPTLL